MTNTEKVIKVLEAKSKFYYELYLLEKKNKRYASSKNAMLQSITCESAKFLLEDKVYLKDIAKIFKVDLEAIK